jgi:2-oxoglutarate ferredoxin oxidoreductase subunit alpha
MTVTSGPGFSLMMEHIGYAAMTETPCVFVDVQRAGPSTGLPTMPAQGDMMQARWGSHGDYGIIALCPNSPQECFDLTIKAFNLAEQFRVPVMLMMDECVGHMIERVNIPPAKEIQIFERRIYHGTKEEYLPFKPDEEGYPSMTVDAQSKLVTRLVDKIRVNADKIIDYREDGVDGAEVVVISYGITSRTAIPAIEQARKEGKKVGHLRLVTVWPFPEKRIRELASKVKAFVVPELNLGQMVYEVERLSGGKAIVKHVPHAGGTVHNPKEIYTAIKDTLNG